MLQREFNQFVARHRLGDLPAVLLAVSGGPDSMALSILARDCLPRAVPVVVDHALRLESAAEAAIVVQRLHALGYAAPRLHRLVWPGAAERPAHLQVAARTARYAALGEVARVTGAHVVLTGHHEGDQIETMLHRLSRGSGVSGLAGMRPVQWLGPLRVVRPLLTCTKVELQALCAAAGVPVVHDPSNAVRVYRRNDIRAHMDGLRGVHLPPLLQAVTSARGDLAHRTRAALAAAVVLHAPDHGLAIVHWPALRACPEPVQVELLRALLTAVATRGELSLEDEFAECAEDTDIPHAVGSGRTGRIEAALPRLSNATGQALHGCLVWAHFCTISGTETLVIVPQPPSRHDRHDAVAAAVRAMPPPDVKSRVPAGAWAALGRARPGVASARRGYATVAHFDHIVVGGGTAGCLLANRLSAAEPRRNVLLLEAGGSLRFEPWVHVPVGYLYCINNPRTDWRYVTEACAGLNGRPLMYPRGKGLGGCSSINGMIYSRGQPRDYDRWAAATGSPAWLWENCLPDFLAHEDHHSRSDMVHRQGGEWRVAKQRLRWDVLDAWSRAASEEGIPQTLDLNESLQSHEPCVGYFEVNQSDGWRWSTAKAFLSPAVKRFAAWRGDGHCWSLSDNGSPAQRLALEPTKNGGWECAAVHVRRGLSGQPCTAALSPAGSVVLSAGSIGSAQLLQVSGVGPRRVLEAAGVAVKLDRAGVGANLQDHLQVRRVFAVQKTRTLNTLASSVLGRASMAMEYALHRTGPLRWWPLL